MFVQSVTSQIVGTPTLGDGFATWGSRAPAERKIAAAIVLSLEANGDRGLLAAAQVDLSAAHFSLGSPPESARDLRSAEEAAGSPEALGTAVPPHLRYEIGVRGLALRLFTGDRPLLGDGAVVGPARRLLPVVEDEKRVDPSIEWVLELLGAVEADNQLDEEVRPALAELLGAPANNTPQGGEFWLNEELARDAAAPAAQLLA